MASPASGPLRRRVWSGVRTRVRAICWVTVEPPSTTRPARRSARAARAMLDHMIDAEVARRTVGPRRRGRRGERKAGKVGQPAAARPEPGPARPITGFSADVDEPDAGAAGWSASMRLVRAPRRPVGRGQQAPDPYAQDQGERPGRGRAGEQTPPSVAAAAIRAPRRSRSARNESGWAGGSRVLALGLGRFRRRGASQGQPI